MTAPPRPPYWVVSPYVPTCRNNHPYLSYKSERGSILEYRGGSPWLLLTCGTCRLHAFGIQDATNEVLHMYAIDESHLETLKRMPRTTRAWVILEFLGYMSPRDADQERRSSGLEAGEASLLRE